MLKYIFWRLKTDARRQKGKSTAKAKFLPWQQAGDSDDKGQEKLALVPS